MLFASFKPLTFNVSRIDLDKKLFTYYRTHSMKYHNSYYQNIQDL